ESHVARVYVHHEHTVPFEVAENRLDFRPAMSELLLLLGTPLREHLVGEVRRVVQVGAGEIQDKGPGNDRHLDDLESVVTSQELRDVAAANFSDGVFLQAEIDVALSGVVRRAFKDLEGAGRTFRLA